ncbi:hypothetical protein ABB04_20575 [Bacillus tropicus]|nr:hypothetical protein [Bacillus tropicus]OTY52101.1 hypothetical protein BK748_21410 [Bacillus thuringiensis serovar graciosensis]PEJ75484.1 hypothetical protein CN685_10270 [Bacillus wiedmannii]
MVMGASSRIIPTFLHSVKKGEGAIMWNIKRASSQEMCEYCKCLLSEWLFWRGNGKKYCSESCAEYDKKITGGLSGCL